MQRTKIEWCDSTWNPVVGCRNRCEYCYARRIATRFSTVNQCHSCVEGRHAGAFHVLEEPARVTESGATAPYPFGFQPTFHRYRLDEPEKMKKPQTIFVCSMADLFGDWVPDEWIQEVFRACEKAPQHRYLFLTKNPARLYAMAEMDLLPKGEHYWFGSTVTQPGDAYFYAKTRNTFVSIEPLLKPFTPVFSGDLKWVIVGAETGNRRGKVTPKKGWVDNICAAADITHAAVFMKDSLLPIMWEQNMRREFPWEGGRMK